MAKSADATDLKSVGEIHAGSSPALRTTLLNLMCATHKKEDPFTGAPLEDGEIFSGSKTTTIWSGLILPLLVGVLIAVGLSLLLSNLILIQ